jgi:hypothetical protein
MTGDRSGGIGAPSWAATDRRASRHLLERERPSPDDGPHKAMEVLAIAQRTAEEHIRTTRAEAERIRAEALESAGEILRDAETQAGDIRRRAEQVMTDADAAADNIERQAQARAAEIERSAQAILAESRERAERLDDDAHQAAEELRRQAKVEHDIVLDRLQSSRESLLRQIESLEGFDREFRQRLLGFLQGQIRALLVDDPQLTGDPQEMLDPGPRPAVRRLG